MCDQTFAHRGCGLPGKPNSASLRFANLRFHNKVWVFLLIPKYLWVQSRGGKCLRRVEILPWRVAPLPAVLEGGHFRGDLRARPQLLPGLTAHSLLTHTGPPAQSLASIELTHTGTQQPLLTPGGRAQTSKVGWGEVPT